MIFKIEIFWNNFYQGEDKMGQKKQSKNNAWCINIRQRNW